MVLKQSHLVVMVIKQKGSKKVMTLRTWKFWTNLRIVWKNVHSLEKLWELVYHVFYKEKYFRNYFI